MSEPIYQELLHHGEQDIDGIRRVWDDITGRFHHHNETLAAQPERHDMTTFTEHVQSVEQHLESFVASAKEKLEQDLPAIASFAQSAASNPLVDAALSAVHVEPSFLQSLATLLADAEAKAAAAAQAAADAAAAQQAALDAANPPAEPEAPAA